MAPNSVYLVKGMVYANSLDLLARCLMGNGRSPSGLTVEAVRERGITGTALPPFHALTVTVPGAAAAWEDAVQQWGRLSLSEVCLAAVHPHPLYVAVTCVVFSIVYRQQKHTGFAEFPPF